MNAFTLTDAAIERALTPGHDVAAPADFMAGFAQAIAEKPGQSRISFLDAAAWQRQVPSAARMLLLLALLGVLLASAIAFASLQHRAVNGHLIVGTGHELLDVDPETGVTSTLVANLGYLSGVTRSVDGNLISFWASTVDGLALEIVDKNGADVRQVATNVTPNPVGQGQIDVWSPDGSSLASGVMVGREQRILVVDIASGQGRLIGPIGAANPLWSPDGQLLAFSYVLEGRSVLAVTRADGTGDPRVISGDLGDLEDSGTNNFSPDGAWVYFGAERNGFEESHIFRANVATGESEQLTFDATAAAPALSPDGKWVAYADWSGPVGTHGIWVMDADGSNQHLLIADAANDGWSNDGQFVLVEWMPLHANHELVVLRPDGTDRTTVMRFERKCADRCATDLGWGQPRP